MFTGIVQAIGGIASIEPHGDDRRVGSHLGTLGLDDGAQGESICVSGICLTVVHFEKEQFFTDVSAETLARTTFGELAVGDAVNLERALTPTTLMGGHLVSGHVDGVGNVVARQDIDRSLGLRICAPEVLAKYIAEKGSICVDGVSLTVNDVAGCEFEVNIVPHTQRQTTLGTCQVGWRLNLEVDIVARYLERLLQAEQTLPTGSKITAEFLAEHGFIRDP
ncbi:MAG: riboflavin synthase [Acidiferrobacterales bacterium]